MDRESLAREYQNLRDEELIRMWTSGNLTELAQGVAETELRSRGIDMDALRPAADASRVDAGVAVSGFATVFSTLDWHQAQALRGRLEAEGVPAQLGDGHTNQTDPLLGPAMGGIRIRVPLELAAEARGIVSDFQRGKFALEDGEAGSNVRAPDSPAKLGWFVWMILAVMAGCFLAGIVAILR
jgi:hypothetical protein